MESNVLQDDDHFLSDVKEKTWDLVGGDVLAARVHGWPCNPPTAVMAFGGFDWRNERDATVGLELVTCVQVVFGERDLLVGR